MLLVNSIRRLQEDDAIIAFENGARGVIVSNHGDRQLDGAIVTIDALPKVPAVGNKIDMLMDGGTGRGGDILKALELGAKAVLIKHPVLLALAVEKQAGVRHLL